MLRNIQASGPVGQVSAALPSLRQTEASPQQTSEQVSRLSYGVLTQTLPPLVGEAPPT